MGYSSNDSHRMGLIFKESGKWAYDVCLDYSGMTTEEYEDWNLWKHARKALAKATENNLSGVIFTELYEGWFMIVPDPMGKSSHPICVYREGTEDKT